MIQIIIIIMNFNYKQQLSDVSGSAQLESARDSNQNPAGSNHTQIHPERASGYINDGFAEKPLLHENASHIYETHHSQGGSNGMHIASSKKGHSNVLLSDMFHDDHLSSLKEISQHLKADMNKNNKQIDLKRSVTRHTEECAGTHDHGKEQPSKEDKYIKSGDFNKKFYMNDFAVEYHIPTAYVLNSRVFTENQDFYYQVVKFVEPAKQENDESNWYVILRLMQIVEGGNQFHKIISEEKFLEKSDMEELITTCFSQDGSMFGYVTSVREQGIDDEEDFYRVVVAKTTGEKGKRPEGLIQTLKSKGVTKEIGSPSKSPTSKNSSPIYYYEHKLPMKTLDEQKFTFESSEDDKAVLKFDTNNRALIGYCKTQFFVFKFLKDKNQMKLGEIEYPTYSRILNLTYTSGDTLYYQFYKVKGLKLNKDELKKAKLYIAVQRSDSFVVDILDVQVSNGGSNIQAKNQVLMVGTDKSILELPYKIDSYDDPPPALHINHNCSMILFASAKERFVVERQKSKNAEENEEFHRYIIPIVKNKYILHYVEEDYDFGGFYIVCSLKEDWQIRVIHSHKHGFKIRHNCTVEHGKLWIYDLNVLCEKENMLEVNSDQFKEFDENLIKTQSDLYVLGRNQQNFIVCHSIFRETRQRVFDSQKLLPDYYPWRQMTSKIISNAQVSLEFKHSYYFDKTVQRSEYEGCTDFKAFSFCWPILAYADSKGYIYIINCFNKNQIRPKRILKDQDAKDNVICKTFVSAALNLYVLVSNGQNYSVYQVGIQEEKLLQQDRDNDKLQMENEDRVELLVTYQDKHIPTKFIVRDKADKKNTCMDKLFVFVLHDNVLRQWRMSKNVVAKQSNSMFPNIGQRSSEVEKELTRVAKVKDGQIYQGYTGDLYYIYDDSPDSDEENGDVQNEDFLNKSSFKIQSHHKRNYADMQHDGNHFIIEQLQVGHMKTYSQMAYMEYNQNDQMITFEYDRQADKFIMLYRQNDSEDDRETAARKGNFKIKIYDIQQERVQIELRVTNMLLLKLFMSGFFCVTDGHIYHANSVVKIRYDLLQQYLDQENINVTCLTEETLFDIYEDVMDIPDGYTVNSANLLFSHHNNRICWIIEDQDGMSNPTTLRFTPYLHDRKIYMDIPRDQEDQNIFVTSLEVDIGETDIIDKNLFPRNKQYVKNKDSDKDKITITHIVRLNFTDREMKVFNQNGLCIKVVDFKEITKGLGAPVAASNDGRFIVMKNLPNKFNKKQMADAALKFTVLQVSHNDLTEHKTYDLQQSIKDQFKGNKAQESEIMIKQLQKQILENELKLQVFVNDDADFLVRFQFQNDELGDDNQNLHNWKALFENNKLPEPDPQDKFAEQFLDHIPKIRESIKEVNYQFNKNDTHNHQHETKEFQKDVQRRLNFEDFTQLVFIACKRKFDEKDKEIWNKKKKQQFLLLQDVFKNFQMEFNEFYIIMQGANRIYQVNLEKAVQGQSEISQQILKIDLKLDRKDPISGYPEVINVYPSPDKDQICIIIKTDDDEHTIVNWQCSKHYEINHHSISGPFFITFDSHQSKDGEEQCNTVIIRKDFTTISELFVDLTCFKPEIRELNKIFEEQALLQMRGRGSMNSSKGLRFDGKSHNWILFQDYMITPFSYMSFMIKDKLDHSVDLKENNFDPAPYDYIFNKSSSFMDSKMVRKDSVELEALLQNLEKYNPKTLSLLNYTVENPAFDEGEEESDYAHVNGFRYRSALSVALTYKNPRSVSFILNYMCKVSKDPSAKIHELFRFLAEYDEFIEFLKTITWQTNHMLHATTFKVVKSQYLENFAFPVFMHRFKKMVTECDFTSPFFSNIGDYMLQSKTAPTLVKDRHYYKYELQKRHETDYNFKGNTQDFYHDYPVRIQAIKCGWMFEGDESGRRKQVSKLIFEQTHLDFLANIYRIDKSEYYHVPYIQMIIDNLFEKLVTEEMSFGNIIFLLTDTVLILAQFIILYQQYTSVLPDQLKDTVPMRPEGVNTKGIVTFNNVGKFKFFGLGLAFLQVAQTVTNVFVQIRKKYGTDCTNYFLNISFYLTDVVVKGLVIYLVYERYDGSSKRYSITKNVLDVKTNKTKDVRSKGELTSYQVASCQADPNCELYQDVEFWRYEQLFQIFVISVFINLAMLVCKFINRSQLFILKMAEFIDLLQQVIQQLIPFMGFTLMFILYAGSIFCVMGQFQLLVDIWYVYENEIMDKIPVGFVTNFTARDMMRGNALQDEQEAIPYDSFWKSILYVYRMMLGEADVETFNAFKRQEQSVATVFLYFTWTFITLLMMIVLLNIIIAIMGQVQEQRTEASLMVKYRHKLGFVISRWDTISSAKSPDREEYIIGVTSLHAQQEENKDVIDTQGIEDKIQALLDKQMLSDITLQNIENESIKIKKQLKMAHGDHNITMHQ